MELWEVLGIAKSLQKSNHEFYILGWYRSAVGAGGLAC